MVLISFSPSKSLCLNFEKPVVLFLGMGVWPAHDHQLEATGYSLHLHWPPQNSKALEVGLI